VNDGSGDSDARADAFREEVRAALPLLLAGVPLAFTIEEPIGANKDGESVRLLPEARFASTSAGDLTAGLVLDEEVARVTWRYAAHVYGMEGSVVRTPVGSPGRVTRNILVGKPGVHSGEPAAPIVAGEPLQLRAVAIVLTRLRLPPTLVELDLDLGMPPARTHLVAARSSLAIPRIRAVADLLAAELRGTVRRRGP